MGKKITKIIFVQVWDLRVLAFYFFCFTLGFPPGGNDTFLQVFATENLGASLTLLGAAITVSMVVGIIMYIPLHWTTIHSPLPSLPFGKVILARVGTVNLFAMMYILISVSPVSKRKVNLRPQAKMFVWSLLTPSTTSVFLLGGVVAGVADNLGWVSPPSK